MNCLELSEKSEADPSIFELFNEMSDGIVIQETNGRFIWANEAMGEIIGIPHTMIAGMDGVEFFSAYFSPVQQNQKVFMNLLKNTYKYDLSLNHVLCTLKDSPGRLFEYSTRVMTGHTTSGLRMNIFRISGGSTSAVSSAEHISSTWN